MLFMNPDCARQRFGVRQSSAAFVEFGGSESARGLAQSKTWWRFGWSNGRRRQLWNFVLCLALLAICSVRANSQTASGDDLPSFQEVFSLIRSNLTGLTETELNRAAVLGLLGQLPIQVLLSSRANDDVALSGTNLVGRSAVFERTQAYIRLTGARPGAAQAFASAFDELRASNRLSGLVLDLRFAAGGDYAEAGAVADLFFSAEQPLIQWGGKAARSTVKTNAISLPVILLVNQRTAGAAEALAAVLRSGSKALIVGAPTAGQTHAFNEFPLSNGQRIGIAAGRIQIGEDQVLSEKGIAPDIQVNVSVAAEKMYLEDPFKALSATAGQSAGSNPPSGKAGAPQPAGRPRRDESSLLRQRQEDDGGSASPALVDSSVQSAVQDPALARALDVLKGLALARAPR